MLKILTYPVRFIPLLISLIIAFVSVFPANGERLNEEIVEQMQRIEALEKLMQTEKSHPLTKPLSSQATLHQSLNRALNSTK